MEAQESETNEPIDFEAALEELETLVSQLESGDLTLEESLKSFEKGVALTRQCQEALGQASLRVNKLLPDGDIEEES